MNPVHGMVLPSRLPIVVAVRGKKGQNLCGWSSLSGFDKRVCARVRTSDNTVHIVLPVSKVMPTSSSDRVKIYVESRRITGADLRVNVSIFLDMNLVQATPVAPRPALVRPSSLPFTIAFASPIGESEVATTFTVAPSLIVESTMAGVFSSASTMRKWLDM